MEPENLLEFLQKPYSSSYHKCDESSPNLAVYLSLGLVDA
jgi:hypothetical protein